MILDNKICQITFFKCYRLNCKSYKMHRFGKEVLKPFTTKYPSPSLQLEIKEENFVVAHLQWCHYGWASNIWVVDASVDHNLNM